MSMTKLLALKPNDSGHDDKRSVVNFRDIVDRDKTYFEERGSQLFVGVMVESLPFRIGVLVAVILNSIVIGLQTNRYLAARYEAIFLGLDRFFQALFTVEILLKWYHDFLGFWRVGWNIFDFVIVGTSYAVPGVSFLSGTRILHVLRVLHAFRSLRSISTLRGLQIVVQTVVYSIPDVAYVMTLLLISIYIFAIIGNAYFGDNCSQNFGTVERTMFSLFICITQDGWLRIVRELNGCGHQIMGSLYLAIFITIGAFIFANLVVAVVVTNLELVIAEKSEVEKKLSIIKQDAAKIEEIPAIVKKYDALFKRANAQKPLILNPKPLDRYVALIRALDENFSEFRRFKEELIKIQEEIQALETLDEVSNEEVLELGSIMASTYVPKSFSQAQKKASRINVAAGDVMTEMLGLANKSPVQVGQAKSIHHMINQLVREPSDHTSTRRPSLLVHPEHSTGRNFDMPPQHRAPDYFSTHRHSEHFPYRTVHISGNRAISAADRRQSSGEHHTVRAERRVSSADQDCMSRRHTLALHITPEDYYRLGSPPHAQAKKE